MLTVILILGINKGAIITMPRYETSVVKAAAAIPYKGMKIMFNDIFKIIPKRFVYIRYFCKFSAMSHITVIIPTK